MICHAPVQIRGISFFTDREKIKADLLLINKLFTL